MGEILYSIVLKALFLGISIKTRQIPPKNSTPQGRMGTAGRAQKDQRQDYLSSNSDNLTNLKPRFFSSGMAAITPFAVAPSG